MAKAFLALDSDFDSSIISINLLLLQTKKPCEKVKKKNFLRR